MPIARVTGLSALALAVCTTAVAASAVLPQTTRDGVARPQATGTAQLSGTAGVWLAADRVRPVRRARVTLEADGSGQRYTADTDTNGRYQFDNLASGRYRVFAEKAGFVRAGAGTPDDANPEPIDVPAGQSVSVNLPLEPAAACEGRVTIDTGEPAVGAIVSAVRFTGVAGARRPIVIQQARTDDLGRFRVHTLPAGEFYLTAAADPLAVYLEARAPGERPAGVARTYYPGTPNADDARVIGLGRGEELRQLDFTLTTVPLAALSGRVVDSAGRTVTAYGIRLQPVGGVAGDVTGLIDPRAGTFQFAAVPPGEYWLLAAAAPAAAPAAQSRTQAEFAAQRVVVSGADQTGMTVALAPAATMSVRVGTDRGAAMPPNLQVRVLPTAFDLPAAPSRPRLDAPIPVGSDGLAAANDVFGPLLIRFANLPDRWALTGVWVDGADVTDTPFHFMPARTHQIRIAITDATATVSGVVQGAQKQPVRARIVVFARDERRWGPGSRFIRSVQSTADGRFRVEGLLPGEYSAAAVGFLPDEAWLEPALLRRLAGSGPPIVVSSTEQVELTLVRREGR